MTKREKINCNYTSSFWEIKSCHDCNTIDIRLEFKSCQYQGNMSPYLSNL